MIKTIKDLVIYIFLNQEWYSFHAIETIDVHEVNNVEEIFKNNNKNIEKEDINKLYEKEKINEKETKKELILLMIFFIKKKITIR